LPDRRRYALVGTGERGLDLFARAIVSTHADVAELVGVGALEAGCDVITEKPMTVDAQCREILSAEHASSGSVRVAFNYRYAPVFTALKQLLVNPYCTYEGMRAAFNGSTGRAEIEVIETREDEVDAIAVYRFGHEEPERVIGVPRLDGHGGGDARMVDDLFRGVGQDPLAHAAGSVDGAYSILVGVAANRSIERGGWAAVDALLGEFAA